MNKVSGYRNMIGLTQKEMAKKLSISEGTYRNKENGISYFKDKEMVIFTRLIKKHNPEVTIDDIFFNHEPTKKDELVKGGA